MDIMQHAATEFMATQGVCLLAAGCEDDCAQSLRHLTGWDMHVCVQFARSYLDKLDAAVRDILTLEEEAPPTQRSVYMPTGVILNERVIVVS